jgi:hypothetical protein
MFAAAFPVSAITPAAHNSLKGAYGKLPLTFESNSGQTDAAVKFLSRGHGYSLFLTPAGAVLRLNGKEKSSVVRWQTAGGNRNPRMVGVEPLATKSDYFIGNDPKKWQTDVPNYAKVRAERVYPGIDLVYHGSRRQVEYDFVVAPKANPNRIRLAFQGLESMKIGKHGELILHTANGDLVQPRPLIYQEENGRRQVINGRYALLAKNEIGFTLGHYDRNRQLTIDPVLLYSTFLGGSDLDQGGALAVDGSGYAYLSGFTGSTSFPGVTGSSLQPSNGGDWDIFLTKIDPTGTSIIYSTFIGGNGGNEYAQALAIDGSGNVYLTGGTNSTNFPGASGSSIQSSYGGGTRDAFAMKINAAGSAIVYSTYLGGSGDELGTGIAVDGSGNAYVTGDTQGGFPGVSGGSIQPSYAGGYYDVFATKINAAGTAQLYSTYLGGSDDDFSTAIKLDGSGNAYIVGGTASSSFPGVSGSSLQPSNGGGYDGFVTEINSSGSAVTWSTFLGDTGDDSVAGLDIDGSGNLYLAGNTTSTSFPGVSGSSIQSSNAGNGDAFVMKMNGSGTSIIYATFLGGTDGDYVLTGGLAIDGSGNAYVGGTTFSTSFPGVSGSSLQPSLAGGLDGFVTRINAAGTSIDFSTYLGGANDDEIDYVVTDGSGNVYVAGWTYSTDFPTTAGAVQTTFGGGDVDAFLAKIGPPGSPVITSISPSTGRTGDQITITGTGFDNVQGSGNVWLGSNYAGSVVSWSNTQVVATIASGVTSGVAQIYQSGVWSNTNSLTVVTPHITSISPSTGYPADQITITGTGFGSSQGSGNVWLGSTYGTVVSWSDTQVVASIASNATSGVAQILQNGVWSNTVSLTVIRPTITSISPTTGRAGDQITITGTAFGSSQGSGNVWLGSTYGTVVSWSDTQVVASIVSGATSGVAQIYQNSIWSNTISLTVVTPHITSISPSSGYPADQITITGTGFGSSQGSGNVWLGSTYGTVVSWSDTQVVASIASTATSGVAQVLQNGVWSNTVSLTVVRPTITSISPTTGRAGDQITINGTSFGASQGSGNVWLGSTYGTVVSWSDTQVVATIVSGATSGVAQIYQNSIWSNTIGLTVVTPSITSISPNHGTTGTQVTITGTGFGTTQGGGNVWLGSTYGTVVSWSDTQVVASVASGATGGVAQILQNGVWSNTISFSVP